MTTVALQMLIRYGERLKLSHIEYLSLKSYNETWPLTIFLFLEKSPRISAKINQTYDQFPWFVRFVRIRKKKKKKEDTYVRPVKDSNLVQPAAVHSSSPRPYIRYKRGICYGYSSSWQRRNPIELSSRFWTLAKRWLSTAGDHLAANIGCERAKDVGKDDDSTGGDPRHSTRPTRTDNFGRPRWRSLLFLLGDLIGSSTTTGV